MPRGLALLFSLVVGCGGDGEPAHTVRWEIVFSDPAVADRAVLVVAEVREGTCAETGAVLYEADIAPGSTAAPVPRLAAGVHAFAAVARDASCTIIARGCADEELPAPEDTVIATRLVEERGGTPICPTCEAGRCASERDAGIDAEGPELDAGPPGPDPPVLVSPWNGFATGSVLGGAANLRPRFAFRGVSGADSYRLWIETECGAAHPSTCAFPSGRYDTLTPSIGAGELFVGQLGEDLVPGGAPAGGTRVHWRMQACAGALCGPFSPTRWLDARERRDVNGDGRADLVAGAPKESRGAATNAGSAYYFESTGSGFADPIALQPLTEDDAWLGNSLDVGDIDGDGYAEMVIGMEESAASGNADAGRILVVRGGSAGPDLGTLQEIAAPDPDAVSFFGQSVAIVDDVDGDGFRDVLVGASRSGDPGRAYLFHGRASAAPLDPEAGAPFSEDDGESRFGLTVTGAGDVDGDGRADFLVASPYAGGGDGRVRLYRTTALGDPVVLDAPASLGSFGWGMAGIGDVNEDGFADFAIGAPFEDVPDAMSGSEHGRVYVYAGTDGSISTAAIFTFNSPYPDVHTGWAIAAGRVDGDAHADLVIAEPAIDWTDAGPRDTGVVAVCFGDGRGGFPDVDYVRQTDVTTGQGDMELGRALAVGDFDADGRADLAAGAPRYDGAGTDSGAVWWWSDATYDDVAGSWGMIDAPVGTGSPLFGYSLPGSVAHTRD